MKSTSTDGWEHGFPIGNGYISGVLYGEEDCVMLMLNGEQLLMPWNSVRSLPDLSDAMEQARKLMISGQELEAAEMFYQTAQERGLKCADPDNATGIPASWHPGCRLAVKTGRAAGDGRLELDFSTGEARYADGTLNIRAFASFQEPMMALLVETPEQSVTVSMLPIPCGNPYRAGAAISDVLRERYIKSETITAKGRKLIHEGRYTTGGGWRMEAEVLGSGAGECTEQGFGISGGPALVLMRFDGAESLPVEGDADENYARMLRDNQPFYRAAAGEAVLELDNARTEGADNEELMTRARQGEIPPELIEHGFDMGAYLCASASGDMPPHAMGRWVSAFDSHIFADYVFNMEAEMCLWPAADRGMNRALDSLDNLIRRNWDDWHENARKMYGARGLMVACRTSDRGLMTQFWTQFPMAFWTAGGAWLSFMLYDRFLHSMDEEYLKETALPFMEEAMLFYCDILRRDHEGRWGFCPSYSPENTPAGYLTGGKRPDSMAAMNASMDIFFVKQLAQDIGSARARLGRAPMPEAEAVLERIPAYRLQEDGTLCEWAHERYEDYQQHRHLSHLVCGYPLFQTKEDAALRRGCSLALHKRLDANLGNEGCGWSWGHILNIAARLEEKETVALAARKILTEYDQTNLVSKLWEKARPHEEYPIPQVDAACALSAGLIEALVYSEPGRIEFLPAWPFGGGTVYGVRLRGGVRMHSLKWSGEEVSVCLEAEKDAETTLKFPAEYGAQELRVHLEGKKPTTFTVRAAKELNKE